MAQWVRSTRGRAHCTALLPTGSLHQTHNLYFLRTMQPFILRSLLFLNDPEDGGRKFLQKMGNY
jgi:hypothetical protein